MSKRVKRLREEKGGNKKAVMTPYEKYSLLLGIISILVTILIEILRG